MANGPELLLKPTHGLSEERRGFLRESAALLVDRKSTRLNSSHLGISYAVFCYHAHRDLHSFPTRRSSDLHHHLAVVGAERNSRHTLKGGEQMDREFS